MTKHEIAFKMAQAIINEGSNYEGRITEKDPLHNQFNEFFKYMADNFPVEDDIDVTSMKKNAFDMLRNGNSITEGKLPDNISMSNIMFSLSVIRYVLHTSRINIHVSECSNWSDCAKPLTPFLVYDYGNS